MADGQFELTCKVCGASITLTGDEGYGSVYLGDQDGDKWPIKIIPGLRFTNITCKCKNTVFIDD